VEKFNSLIHFRCRMPGHQQLAIFDGEHLPSPITFHDGHWAYCPAGATSGHEWTKIAPAALDEARIWQAPEPRRILT
jgi:hypothetical protein